jgi:hypothetical protein
MGMAIRTYTSHALGTYGSSPSHMPPPAPLLLASGQIDTRFGNEALRPLLHVEEQRPAEAESVLVLGSEHMPERRAPPLRIACVRIECATAATIGSITCSPPPAPEACRLSPQSSCRSTMST